MEPDALRRRLRREHLRFVEHDPKKARDGLYVIMQDFIQQVANNRHVPEVLRSNANVLRMAWDTQYAKEEGARRRAWQRQFQAFETYDPTLPATDEELRAAITAAMQRDDPDSEEGGW